MTPIFDAAIVTAWKQPVCHGWEWEQETVDIKQNTIQP